MIAENGYLKLIDFGTAIIIKDFTNTLTGTPNYIAPEVLLGKGYSFSSDYWSIGITAFELYFNYYPYGNDATDPLEVYRDILKNDLKFPSINKEEEGVCKLISSLLKKRVPERCCSLEMIKALQCFDDFKFNELIDLKLKAPFIPNTCTMIEQYLSNTKIKYSSKLDTIKKKNSGASDEEIKEDEDVEYDQNWADEF